MILLLLLVPTMAWAQETRTSLGVNLFSGYSGVRYLNGFGDIAQDFESGIGVFRANGFFEYALTEKRKAHVVWGFGFDQSGHSFQYPVSTTLSQSHFRQYYLYLPVSLKYKWSKNFYSSLGMAGGALIESREIDFTGEGKSRNNDNFFYREFQLSTILNTGYEIPLRKNHVLFFEVSGAYNWLGKLTDDAAEDHTQRAAWQAGLGIGIMKRF